MFNPEVGNCDAQIPVVSTVGRGISGINEIRAAVLALVAGTVPVGSITNDLLWGEITGDKLDDNTVADGKLATVPGFTIKGRNNADAGGLENLTVAEVLSLLGLQDFASAIIQVGELATSVIDASNLTAGTLPIARIAAGAIGNAQLGSDINADKLTAGTLPIARIADGAITKQHINKSFLQAGIYTYPEYVWATNQTRSVTLNYHNFGTSPVVVACMYTTVPSGWEVSISGINDAYCTLNVTRIGSSLPDGFGPKVSWIATDPNTTI